MQIILARVVVSALFTAVIAGTWDAWWHGALGRESFFSPPHLLLYSSVLVAIATGIYGWYKTKEHIWKRLAICLALVPVSAPFDEIWHRLFGVESIGSPLIVWSPPHVILIFSIIASALMTLPILNADKDREARRLFSTLCFAAVFSLLLFLVSPLEPFGPYHLLGFWGAGFVAAVFVGTLLAARMWSPGVGSGMMYVAFVCLISSFSFGEKISAEVLVPPHDHAPSWLQMFSLIVPGFIADSIGNIPMWMKGGLVGIVQGAILYPVATLFFDTAFKYGSTQIATAVAASALGGVVAGFIVSQFKKTAKAN